MFSWKRCAGCQQPSEVVFCVDCQSSVGAAPLGEVWAAWRYSGAVANAIIDWKQRHALAAGDALTAAASERLPTWPIDLVVVVPPAFWRTLWRGFHPPDAFGKAAAKKLRAGFSPRLLRRVDDARQMGKSRGQRARRLFTLRSRVSLAGKNVLIVDDVTTSGATLRDAARALAEASPQRIYFAALAAVP